MHFKASKVEFSKVLCFFFHRRFVLILANSEDPDEMQHCAAFHLCLHCLPKYPFRGLQ